VESIRPRRLTPLLPVAGVVVFVGLYAVAAWLYPGGTREDPGRTGFSFVDNYWCDLLDRTTYGGRPNPSASVGVTAMVVLSAGLAVLWWTVPVLFPRARRTASLVRLAGLGSGVIAPCVATRFHDLAIHVSGLLAVIAFVATMTALGRRVGIGVRAVAALALGLSLATYLVWQTRVGLSLLPLVQKAAFAAFLGWIVLVAREVAREGRTAEAGDGLVPASKTTRLG
jgi:hypothetical protein